MGRPRGALDRRNVGLTFAERVLARAVESEGPLEEPCLLWTGAVSSNGYGHLKLGGRHRLAHKVVWEEENGPVSDGLELHHRCERTLCVRGSHLEAVTHAENVRLGRRWRLTPA